MFFSAIAAALFMQLGISTAYSGESGLTETPVKVYDYVKDEIDLYSDEKLPEKYDSRQHNGVPDVYRDQPVCVGRFLPMPCFLPI